MESTFPSGGLTLRAHRAVPSSAGVGSNPPAVVLCHGFPGGVAGAKSAAVAYPELGDRIAAELGWLVLVPTLRGAGGSEGHFSLAGWLDDIAAAVAHVRATALPSGIWLVGFGTGACACAPPPGTPPSRAWPPSALPPTSTTGRRSRGAGSSTPGRSG